MRDVSRSLSWLFALSLMWSQSAAAEHISFAFADDEPPVSYRAFHHGEAQVAGILPDLLRLVFSQQQEHDPGLHAYPWARAQYMVESGQHDGLFTYPSAKRKGYMQFTPSPAYFLDFGYLVFHKDNPHRLQLEHARSFEDLRSLTMIGQLGAEWEDDNVPSFIVRAYAPELTTLMKLLLERRSGDFAIMQPEQARYLAQQLGMEERLALQKVDFIPDSLIPFHLGIRSNHPNAAKLVQDLEQVLSSSAYQQQRQQLLDAYLGK